MAASVVKPASEAKHDLRGACLHREKDRRGADPRPLRLPKEHDTGKQVVWIIVRHGHIYPVRNADLSRNETDINWTTELDSEIAEPIRGRGIDPVLNSGALSNYFDQPSRDEIYFAFNVFEDSFPAFIQAKQIAIRKDFRDNPRLEFCRPFRAKLICGRLTPGVALGYHLSGFQPFDSGESVSIRG